MKPIPIGILGGTFDPIHCGHIHLANAAFQQLDLQEVRLIPCYQPVHRAQPAASPEDRMNMVKLAIDDHTGLTMDDREIRRGGPSYMIDTLQSLRKEVGNTPLYLIMASDAFAEFNHWQRWQEIPNLTHLVIVNRPEYPLTLNSQLKKLLQEREVTDSTKLRQKPAGYIYFLHTPLLPISATEIRQLLAAGKEPKNLLPKVVWKYIQKKSLFV